MKTRVSVCGVVYSITHATEQTDIELVNNLGYVDFKAKRIVINSMQSQEQKARTLRHELVHAFFKECGFECYSEDETLVCFLEYQLPKIFALCKETKTL